MPATKGSPTTPEPSGHPGRSADTATVPPKEREKARQAALRAKQEKKLRAELGIRNDSPRWWAPVMVTLMVLGLLWVVVFYVSQGTLPIKAIGAWNLAIGAGLALVGFLMTTRWT